MRSSLAAPCSRSSCSRRRARRLLRAVGSGIEHAEGGGTPAGQNTHGFQIWLRMPKAKMKDDPRYGTVNPDAIPTVPLGPNGSLARVIAGPLGDVVGPAKFAVSVQMLDVELAAAGTIHPRTL